MYSYDSVKTKLEEQGMTVYPVEIPFDIIEGSICLLQYSDFIRFATENGIETIFLYDRYIEVEEYLITDEILDSVGINNHLIELIADAIDSYNESLLSDKCLTVSKYIFAICLWNNQRFVYIFQNEIQFEGKPLMEPEDKLQEIIEENKDIIFKDLASKEQEKEQQREELKQDIINDPKFKDCTNKRFRRNYIYTFFEEPCKYDVLKEYWTTKDGILRNEAFDFIEMLWKDFKNQ